MPQLALPQPSTARQHGARRAAGVLVCSLATMLLHGLAQSQSLDEQLAASLAALPAPLVVPRPPQSMVVPAQVQRWREEAQALEHGENGLPRDPARAATL